MVMNARISGLPNRVLAATLAYGGTSHVTPDVWPTTSPSDIRLFSNASPRNTWVGFTGLPSSSTYPYTSGGGHACDHMAMIGVNASPGRAQWRGVVGNASFLPRIESVLPSGVTLTNYTGAVGDIDDLPWYSDTTADYIVESASSGPCAALIDFATPVNTPVTGTDLQMFVIEFALPSVGGTGFFGPVTFELYESGSLKTALNPNSQCTVYQVSQPFTSSFSVIRYCFTWDAALLTTASGENVQFRISRPAAAGAFLRTGLMRIYSVEWICDSTSNSTLYKDTGWLTAPAWDQDPLTSIGATFRSDIDYPDMTRILHSHFTSVGAGACFNYAFFLRDLSPPVSSPIYPVFGTFCGGESFSPSKTNLSRNGSIVKWVDASSKKRSRSGGTYGQVGAKSRELTFPLTSLTKDEAYSLANKIDSRRGVMAPVLVSMYPDGSHVYEREHTTVWGTLKDQSAFDHAQFERLKRQYVFEEFL